MQLSLAYITTTSTVSLLGRHGHVPGAGPHTLDPLGYDSEQQSIYFLEHYDDESGDLPQLFIMHTRGSHMGRLIPVRSWYEGADEVVEARFEERLAELRSRLVPLEAFDKHRLQLTTRVIMRRALRLYPDQPPIRKYSVRLSVRALGGRALTPIGASTVVTSFLRARAHLVEAYRVPGERAAVVVLSYVGVPYELGYDKQTALLLPL